MIDKLLTLLKTNVAFRTAVGAFLGFFVMCSGYVIITTAYTMIENGIVESTPRSAYFDYKSVEFVGREANSLVMASTSVFKSDHPVYWNDILRCEGVHDYRFHSVQNTSSESPNTRHDYRTLEWHYNEPFPEGKRCYMESTITMDVNGHTKRQKIDSMPFLIPKSGE